MTTKRTYSIRRFYTVTCSECNENICERSGEPTTRAEAELEKRDHEAQHHADDLAAVTGTAGE